MNYNTPVNEVIEGMARLRMSFPDLLQHLRESHLMTMSELAQKAGMAKSHISMLEAGTRRPGMKVIQKLGAALGLTGEDERLFTERAIIASRRPATKPGRKPPPNIEALREQLVRTLLPPEGVAEKWFLDSIRANANL